MKTTAFLGISLALAVAASCGGSSRVDRATGDLGTQIGALRNSTLDHGTHIAAASSLAAITPEEEHHHFVSLQREAAMSSDISTMMAECGGLGTGPDFGDIRGALDELHRESDGHLLAMDSVKDMSAAQSEEGRHQSTMTKLLDRMESLRDGMLDENGHLDCMGGTD